MMSGAAGLALADSDQLSFIDTDLIGLPYREAIAALLEAEFISGYGDGTFRPHSPISRAEAAVMISNALQADSPAMTEIINVQDYGALGNGMNDDTAAINRTITYAAERGGGTVYIPGGTYLIDVDISVRLEDNINLVMTPDTVLKAKPTKTSLNAVIEIGDVTNSTVNGGKIIGERYEHLARGGEWGRGIEITGSNHIRISNVVISSCWGDGIYVGSNNKQDYSADILIERFSIDDCRRTGITVVSSKNLIIRDGLIANTNGTVPEAGINLEPNKNVEMIYNALVENVQTVSNNGYGIDICFCNIPNASGDISIIIKNHTDRDSRSGLISRSCPYFQSKYLTYT